MTASHLFNCKENLVLKKVLFSYGIPTNDSFSFVIVPTYRPYHFPIFLLKSLLKGKMVRAPSLKKAFL